MFSSLHKRQDCSVLFGVLLLLLLMGEEPCHAKKKKLYLLAGPQSYSTSDDENVNEFFYHWAHFIPTKKQTNIETTTTTAPTPSPTTTTTTTTSDGETNTTTSNDNNNNNTNEINDSNINSNSTTATTTTENDENNDNNNTTNTTTTPPRLLLTTTTMRKTLDDPLVYAWPRVVVNGTLQEAEEPWKIFEQLATDNNNNNDGDGDPSLITQNEMLEAIRMAWDNDDVTGGVIVGANAFDQIVSVKGEIQKNGPGLKAFKAVVQHLGVSNEDVVVVLQYTTPRFHPWAKAYFMHHHGNDNYAQYMCSASNQDALETLLETSMHPMGLAQTFLEFGWNVRMVDVEGKGLQPHQRTVANAVACDVLEGVDCDTNGNVRNPPVLNNNNNDDTTNDNDNQKYVTLFDERAPERIAMAERLFLYRDCAYRVLLGETLTFDFVNLQQRKHNNNDSDVGQPTTTTSTTKIWSKCVEDLDPTYIALKDDVSILYTALLSQVHCGKVGMRLPVDANKEMITMRQVLSGRVVQILQERKQQNSLDGDGGDWKNVLVETCIFLLILIVVLMYQVFAMIRAKTASSRAGMAEYAALPVNGVDAEYGDVDDDPHGEEEDEEERNDGDKNNKQPAVVRI